MCASLSACRVCGLRTGSESEPSHDAPVALGDDGKDLVRVVLPPVAREDLDLDRAVVAGRLDLAADAPDVDHAIAHHAAIEQQVPGRHQPVADVEGEDATGGAGAADLRFEARVPPQVIDVDGDPDPA